ncbi:erythromycin esterase family protein [Geodermatophilus sp. YIM 151500]|uniref:erythromycin esterase family protein n=1 Tax=Geodermatophilus sp. YIM 151500 TaxID=2984531 RepID=UPI0021E41A9B|nr:erythromycin esterase family protein [Geodermatophilus sp. YIM 151500]MCV2488746.1 erythromycin esterase family protein [Geodermatophilus sp. YIM 151500]
MTFRISELTSLDPDAVLDDLEPLREVIGSARVVAVGENAHFISEFARLRHRILRFLVERCGFTVLAHESGFSEGFALDGWVQGERRDDELPELAEECIASGLARPAAVREMFRWLRARNAPGVPPVRFAGIDVPGAAGSLLPSLHPLAPYLDSVDPAARRLLDPAVDIATGIAGTTQAASAPGYLAMDAARQDALTAELSRLADRFDALAPTYLDAGGRAAYDLARWRLEGARAADHQLRGIAGAFAGTALPAAATSRERYMAATVGWWLDRLDPGERVVLMAHNAHIQRTPVVYGGELQVLPLGQHLDRVLGNDYAVVGLTSGGGRTAALHPDAEAGPYGFRIQDTALDPPEPGSIEAALAEAGAGLGIADLRAARGDGAGPDRIRLDSDYLATPVVDAFDAVVHVPESHVAVDLGF